MDRRKLYRNTRAVDRTAPIGNPTDIIDRVFICLVVPIGVFHGAGRFAQHIIGIAIALFLVRLGTFGGLINGAAHHELAAHDAHGLIEGLANDRLARSCDHALKQTARVGLFRLAEFDDLPGQHQPPGRRIDKETVGMTQMALPIRIKQLVLNKFIGGNGIWHAQQCFGQTHQNDAFLARQFIFMEQRINAAFAIVGLANIGDQLIGA